MILLSPELTQSPHGTSLAFHFLLEAQEPMGSERRDIQSRAAVVQRVIEGIVQNPSVTLTVSTLQQWLGVPVEAAQRILDRLASSGLVR